MVKERLRNINESFAKSLSKLCDIARVDLEESTLAEIKALWNELHKETIQLEECRRMYVVTEDYLDANS